MDVARRYCARGGSAGGRAVELPDEGVPGNAARVVERHHARALPRQRDGRSLGDAPRVSRRCFRRQVARQGTSALGVRERDLGGLRFLEKREAGMNAPERLDPARTALLFFDMLNGHVKKNDAETKARYAPVIASAVRLLEGARRAGAVVMYA